MKSNLFTKMGVEGIIMSVWYTPWALCWSVYTAMIKWKLIAVLSNTSLATF